jgi:uncharacterized delta-60 repeat protein
VRALLLTLALGAVALLAAPGSALAAAGDLDPTFSGDGIATLRSPDTSAAPVAVDSRGRIITSSFRRIVRFRPDGTLDSSFSGDGQALPPFVAQGDEQDSVNSFAVDSHDRIVAVGQVRNSGDPQGHFEFAVAVLRPNGTPDPSFSGDGWAKTTIGDSEDDLATDVAVDSQGRIVIAGFSDRRNAGQVLTLARYLPNGTLDRSFSGDGRLQAGLPSVENTQGRALALDSAGRIVVVGSGDDQFAVARFTPAGRLDPTFSGNGSVVTPMDPSGRESHAEGIAIDDSGRIVVVGDAGRITLKMALARYKPNGTLDTSFSDDGKVLTSFNRERNFGSGVAIDEQERIVATGTVFDLVHHKRQGFGVARFTSHGTLDPAFSGDGRATASIGTRSGSGGVALDAQGKIVVSAYGNAGRSLQIAVARFLSE